MFSAHAKFWFRYFFLYWVELKIRTQYKISHRLISYQWYVIKIGSRFFFNFFELFSQLRGRFKTIFCNWIRISSQNLSLIIFLKFKLKIVNSMKVMFPTSARLKLGFHFSVEQVAQANASDVKLLSLLSFSLVAMSFMNSNQLLILSSVFSVNLKREFQEKYRIFFNFQIFFKYKFHKLII